MGCSAIFNTGSVIPKRFCAIVAFVMLLSHVALVVGSALSHSPVNGEVAHLCAGASHVLFGRYDLFRVNPPLVRTVAALPIVFASPTFDWEYYDVNPLERREFLVEQDFVRANAKRLPGLIAAARCACIPFTLLGGIVCYSWAGRLYGDAAGLTALFLWCFSPWILGHASLMTPDAHAAAIGLAAGYSFWQWLRTPRWLAALVAGLLLGLAELCKLTLLIFYPSWLLLWLLYRLRDWGTMEWRDWMRECCMGTVIVLVSLYVINSGYLFEGSFKRLSDFRFQTRALTGASTLSEVPAGNGNRFRGTWVGWIPVPLPDNYVQGIDTQRLDFERVSASYLRGEWADHGWWYYYVYALLIKTPVGMLLLVLLAFGMTVGDIWRTLAVHTWPRGLGQPLSSSRVPMAAWRPQSHSWCDEMALMAPGLAILILVSSQTGFSAHSRYVLPALPFLFVWTSKAARVFGRRNVEAVAQKSHVHERLSSGFRGARGTWTFVSWRGGARMLREDWVGRCRRPVLGALVVVALVWSVCSTFAVYPHSISYFNELAAMPVPADAWYAAPTIGDKPKVDSWAMLASWASAGPRNGPRHLLDSNIDWGQDLFYLESWYDSHPEARPIRVAYVGTYPLDQSRVKSAGVPRVGPDEVSSGSDRKADGSLSGPLPGWYALSVNSIYSRGQEYRYFLRFSPVATAGYSIYIYHITIDEANEVRRELGLSQLPK
jgi:hypothetical protein